METVELIYDHDCPNVAEARAQLLRAFVEAALSPRWSEWERSDPTSPDYARSYGSPTILVGGKDVAGVAPSDNISCCRLYPDPSGGMLGVPSVQVITSALQSAGGHTGSEQPGRKVGWRSSIASLLGIGAALLPSAVCPACWPVYAGLLSVFGLGFLLDTAYLLPVIVVFLLVSVGALAFRAKTRRGYGPFVAGLIALGIVLIGKFGLGSDAITYSGIALLVIASLWNAWPRKAADVGSDACSACAPGGQASHSQEPGAKEVSS